MMNKAAATRLTILSKALELIYRAGYQATSIDDILAQTAVTKGAFYYHFKNKDEMGLAMIREVVSPALSKHMVAPLLKAQPSADELYNMMKSLLSNEELFDVNYGCPVVNLIDEMAPLNADFKEALSELTLSWKNGIRLFVVRAQKAGSVNASVKPDQVALVVISGYAGIRNTGKLLGKSCYTSYLKEFKNYIQMLK